ncbi:hypothetical protein HOY82DRAFT_491901, partial [Tuber indicum]
GASMVEEFQLGAVMRYGSHGASGAKVHGVPAEWILSFRTSDWHGAFLDRLSSDERKLYGRFHDDDSADKDCVSPVKWRAAGPASEPMRLIAGTLSSAQ